MSKKKTNNGQMGSKTNQLSTKRKTIILIAGNMRSGKDSFAKQLMELLDSATIEEITSYLKEGVAEMLNITREQVDELKDSAQVAVMDDEGVVSTVTIRRILQRQADINRQYITCEKAMEKLMSKDRDYYLLTGVRLPDEVELIKRLHADKRVITVKIERDNFEFKSNDKLHKTETLVDLIKEDFLISASNLEELEAKTEAFYTHYLLNN